MSQIRKGARVRFKQDAHDIERRRRLEGDPKADPPVPGDPTIIPLVPGPSEAFTVLGIVDEHWANLGPAHPMVALTILEPA